MVKRLLSLLEILADRHHCLSHCLPEHIWRIRPLGKGDEENCGIGLWRRTLLPVVGSDNKEDIFMMGDILVCVEKMRMG